MNNQSRHVLVVENDPTMSFVAKAQLKKIGIEADFAANGEEAVRMAATTDYALILMDLMMPEMDGLQATRMIRERQADGGRSRSVIVAVTALPDPALCRDAGMDDLLVKPIMLEQLRSLMERWLPQPRDLSPECKSKPPGSVLDPAD